MSEAQPADSVPYLLLGESRRRRLQTMLNERLSGWRAGWAMPAAEPLIVTLETDCTQLRAPQTSSIQVLQAAAGGRPRLGIIVAGDVLTAVLGVTPKRSAYFAIDPPARNSLMEALQMDVLKSLGVSLLAAAGCDDISLDRSPESAGETFRNAARGRHVAAHVHIGTCAALILLMPPELIDAWAPIQRNKPSAAVLTRRMDALHEETVPIEVLLGHTDISLGELTSLAPGNVIVFGEVPLQPVLSTVDGGKRFAEGDFGCSGGKCAVRISKTFRSN